MPKQYDFKAAEQKWIRFWQDQKLFSFDLKQKGKLFSIDTPPPTFSGAMHVGHAFSYAHEDFIARYKRMQGFNVFYPFGTDDNGLPTEKLVEKEKKVRATKMPRDEFRALCSTFIKEHLDEFSKDWLQLGMSCDFTKPYSTIDTESQKRSQLMFLDLYERGFLYREETPVAWDTRFQTSIAQAEFENIEMTSHFNDIVFKSGGKDLIIATTRPELLPACVALFFHPDDERYQKLEGKHAKAPLFNHDVPIMTDASVDKEKGTGLMMVCTFGDKEDIEKYFKYKLPCRIAITKNGRMNELAGKYQGMEIKEARKKITEDLKQAKLLIRQEQITHNVNVYEKSGREIEFLVANQWFIRVLDKKQELIDLGNKINWFPQHMQTRYTHWIQNLNWDWSISRQRSFGIPFPVWYEKETGKIILADKDQLPVDPLKDKPRSYKGDPKNLVPETDVLDTWATSSLTPLLAFDRHGLSEKHVPMDVRPQAHDIIRTWLFYTVVRVQYHFNRTPWKNVMISGFVTDPHGRKMSKSKGNVVDPKQLLDKYGADVLRYWAAGGKLGDDLPYLEKEFVAGKKTVTKLWNAIKFTITHLEGYQQKKPEQLHATDAWMLSKLQGVIRKCTDAFDQYEYAKTRFEADQFFWQAYCDYYLELVKDRIYNKDAYTKDQHRSAQHTLYQVSLCILKLYAPIMPFITEELYQLYYAQFENAQSISVSKWPKPEAQRENKIRETAGDRAIQVIAAVRKFKSDQQMSIKKAVSKITIKSESKDLEPFLNDIRAVCNASNVVLDEAATPAGEGLWVDVEA